MHSLAKANKEIVYNLLQMATLTRDSHLMPNSNQDYSKGKKTESKKQKSIEKATFKE